MTEIKKLILIVGVMSAALVIATLLIFIYTDKNNILRKFVKWIYVTICAAAIVFIFYLILITCYGNGDFHRLKYNDKWIIGKTSEEIIERYGEFDHVWKKPDYDGLYRDCTVEYFLINYWQATVTSQYYTIHFNNNGRADEVGRRSGEHGG